jgi:glycerate 2-kinase
MVDGDRVRHDILAAFRAAIAACDPATATRGALETERLPDRVRIVAMGKAAPAMARGAAEVLGDRLIDGLVVCDHPEAVPDRMELLIGSHPRPDADSETAGRRALEAAARPDAELLMVLVSGGGSALAEVPRRPVSVSEIADLCDALMDDGAPIAEINTVRRHLSELKNGGLLRSARAPVLTLLMSDVGGAPASAIASGPTLSDDSTPEQALAVLHRHGIDPPPAVREVLTRERLLQRPSVAHRWRAVADGALAARAASRVLDNASILTMELEGEASTSALDWIEQAPIGYSVLTGETTVHVGGGGTGGRNQHAALAAAIAIEGSGVVFAAFGTDGRDGHSDAAGAIVDGSSLAAIRAAGIDPLNALATCDSTTALEAAGSVVRTGPTGTNVGDLWIIHRA